MTQRLKVILADFLQQADLVLLGLCCAATLYGMALIASATHFLTPAPDRMMRYVGVQGMALVIGIFAYIFMSVLDLDAVMKRWKWLVVFNIVFIGLLLTPLGVGKSTTGNQAWLALPFLPFQIGPAEVVKITFTLLLAKQLAWLREEKNDLKSFPAALSVGGHALALIGYYTVISGDMGNALTFFFIFLFMAFVAGFALRWFVLLLGGGAAAAALVWTLELLPGYIQGRFRVIFDHSYDVQGAGWQQTRSLLAIGSGGVFGQGYMSGLQTQSAESTNLPARRTDLIFSVCGEELGLVGCLLIGGDYFSCAAGGPAGGDLLLLLCLRGHCRHADLPDGDQHRHVPLHHAGHRRYPALFQLRRVFHCHAVHRHGGGVRHQDAVGPAGPAEPL